MGKIIAIANQKGGVGKTTTAVCLATGLKMLGKKTLLVDVDAQKNSTHTYRAKSEGVATIYDLLFGELHWNECVQHTEIGDIIASDSLMTNAESRFPNDASRNHVMKMKCQGMDKEYDYIIIDTPPQLGFIITNVLTFADEVIITITPSKYALEGMDAFYQTVQATKMYTNPALNIRGILVTKYHSNEKLSRKLNEKLPEIEKMFGTTTLLPKIRQCSAVEKSQDEATTLFAYDIKSTTAQDYMELCMNLAVQDK